jgi:kinesin family member 2/24
MNANASGKRQSLAGNNNSSITTSGGGGGAAGKMDATRKRIADMEKEREERRKSMLIQKEARSVLHAENLAKGNPGDVDFIGMVERWRQQERKEHHRTIKMSSRTGPVTTTMMAAFSKSNICIAVRKRPMSAKERAKLDHDSVSVFSPQVTVHSAKYRVDGITKYLTHNSFQLDHAFDETSTTEEIYVQTTLPLVDHVLASKGRATVFCYGQTGSGKTFTMNGIQQILAYDLYSQIASSGLQVRVAMFELYGGFVQDLLHERQRCKLLEDSKGEINITGLQDVPAPTAEDLLRVLEEGNRYVEEMLVRPWCKSYSHHYAAFEQRTQPRPMTPHLDPMPFVRSC